MADTALSVVSGGEMTPQTLEAVLLGGDIERLSPQQRVSYMLSVCKSIGLNPLTKPFEFIKLNGRLVMYARKDCTEQLRNIRGISIKIVARELTDGIYVVTAQATDKTGRTDESVGAVPLEGLKGEAKANAVMKAETKAKRRVTLSISGLGMLDESEIESIPGAQQIADVPGESLEERLNRAALGGPSVEEKLKASVALAEAKKVAAQKAKPAGEYTMKFPSKSEPPKWQVGDPISSLESEDIVRLLKWKGARDDLKAACLAELAVRGETPEYEHP